MELQVGVKALIKNESGNYLLLKRTEPYPEESEPRWDIPGGRINIGEPIEQALQREITEETGLTITNEPRIIQAQDILRNSDKHVVRLTYLVQTVGEIKLNPQEHTDFVWCSLEKISELRHDIYLDPILKTLQAASSASVKD
ncbi:NUDIX hydrolase [Patescibacteria group bacterium]|nr:NUDIX hydrolase [Patescibacteria group bacterium]